MIADWIDAELRNWAAWCWEGPWPHPIPPDHAASAEGRYLAPSDIDNAPAPRPIRANRQRAEVVHRVYREQLTDRERRVLALAYVRQRPICTVPRLMRVSERAVHEAIIAAGRRVGDAFRESHALRC